jgi:hypothetical protein
MQRDMLLHHSFRQGLWWGGGVGGEGGGIFGNWACSMAHRGQVERASHTLQASLCASGAKELLVSLIKSCAHLCEAGSASCAASSVAAASAAGGS